MHSGNRFLDHRSAFPRSHSKKRCRFLLNILAVAVRALGIFLVVLIQGENQLERLMAIEADIVVNGHGNLPCNA